PPGPEYHCHLVGYRASTQVAAQRWLNGVITAVCRCLTMRRILHSGVPRDPEVPPQLWSRFRWNTRENSLTARIATLTAPFSSHLTVCREEKQKKKTHLKGCQMLVQTTTC